MSASFGVRLRRYWVAGILVLAPTALTLWVVWKLFTFFDDILGGQLRARGISVVGLGFVLLNALLLLLGFIAANFFGKRAVRAVGPAHAPRSADQQDLRDAAPDRRAPARALARRRRSAGSRSWSSRRRARGASGS